MPAVQIDIAEDTIAQLTELARLCTEADQANDGATTHGPLTVSALVGMLAEDAAMIVRPTRLMGGDKHGECAFVAWLPLTIHERERRSVT